MFSALPGLSLVIALVVFAPSAAAADNKVAVVVVNNPTKDLAFNFDYRWGDGKWETVKGLQSGKAIAFSHPLDAKGRAPGFQVKLNRAIGTAKPVTKTWNLDWKPAPRTSVEFGKHYEIFRDLIDRDYVWLAEVGRR